MLTSPVTPREYAGTVNSYSHLQSTESLHTGSHFMNLAAFLLQAYESHPSDLNPIRTRTLDSSTQDDAFVVQYCLKNGLGAKFNQYTSPAELWAFEDHIAQEQGSSNVLFLRGYPTPQWLNTVGAKFSIDPEFFRRHLDFRNATPASFDTSLPTLPSATFNMTKLKVTTMASRLDTWTSLSQRRQVDLDRLRQETSTAFQVYQESLRRGGVLDAQPGDSIVRAFSILDHDYLAIEQDVSIYLDTLEGKPLGNVKTPSGKRLTNLNSRHLARRVSRSSPDF
jgi:hypothetical protein